jgi:hypothetical protein
MENVWREITKDGNDKGRHLRDQDIFVMTDRTRERWQEDNSQVFCGGPASCSGGDQRGSLQGQGWGL